MPDLSVLERLADTPDRCTKCFQRECVCLTEATADKCPRCEGTGIRRVGYHGVKCSLCNGTGLLSEAVKEPDSATVRPPIPEAGDEGVDIDILWRRIWQSGCHITSPSERAAAEKAELSAILSEVRSAAWDAGFREAMTWAADQADAWLDRNVNIQEFAAAAACRELRELYRRRLADGNLKPPAGRGEKT